MKRPELLGIILSLAGLFVTGGVAHADDGCRLRLQMSFDRPSDVTGCDFVAMTNGRLVAVQSRFALFVRTRLGEAYSLHKLVKMVAHGVKSSGAALPERIERLDQFPEVDWFYQPFVKYMSREEIEAAQQAGQYVCLDPRRFSAWHTVPCN